MTTDAIHAQNSPNISPTDYVDPLPQTRASIPADYVTPPSLRQTGNLRPPEKEPPTCSPKPVPPERKLPTCSPKRVLTAGLYGIAGGGFIFGMLASCTILGGVAGVILGLAANGAANLLLKSAIITLIGAFKEPNNPNYTRDFFIEMNVTLANFRKQHPILFVVLMLTTINLVIAAFISIMALGGTQGIILGLALNATVYSTELLLTYLLNHRSKIKAFALDIL